MGTQNVRTTCPYCAVGCNLYLTVTDGKIIGVIPSKEGSTNDGALCIKGWHLYEFVQHIDRLNMPLIRTEGMLQKTSWEDAMVHASSALISLKETYGSESIAFVGSARCTNEETYIFQKFVRAVFGHNHVDHCARL
jgi:predicted molibdopterin-dependent oxidoreductase YjgC